MNAAQLMLLARLSDTLARISHQGPQQRRVTTWTRTISVSERLCAHCGKKIQRYAFAFSPTTRNKEILLLRLHPACVDLLPNHGRRQ